MGPNGERTPISGGEGSGFVFRPDGYIITNDHVVGGFDEVKVTLKDGRDYIGKVTRAEDSDIAVVKIEAKDLPTLALADSSRVRAGQTVMAVGAPFGLDQSVTFGHVSALGRESAIENKMYPDLIQTDASINMGNSGGPLVNIDGQVIGINTSILSPSGVSAGIGFAIPSNQVRFIAEMLVNKGKVTRSMIGVVPTNLKDYQKKDMKLAGGALVETVQSDSAAAAAGIQKGDVIVKIGTTVVNNQLDLRNAMLVYTPGTTVPVELVRDGAHKTVNVKLVAYKRPESPTTRGQGGQNFSWPKDFPKDFDPFKDMPGLKDAPGFHFPDDSSNDGAQSQAQPKTGHARLGVGVGDNTDDARAQYNIPSGVTGAVVGSVTKGSVADKLGIQPGDVVVSFDGKKITQAQDLTSAMENVKWGDTKQIKFIHYSKGAQISKDLPATFK
jgi:serine protease Do